MAIVLRDKTTASQQAAIQSDGSLLIQPQALTKGTQGANGFSVQDLKDSGRTTISWTIDKYPSVQTAELMMTVTESRNGAATTTFTNVAITNGKRFRLQHISAFLKTTTGTAPQTCHIGLRFNTAGAATTSSPLVWRGAIANNAAVNLTGTAVNWDFPDGMEFLGDGTKTIGPSCAFPEWVTASAVATLTLSIIAFEY